MGGVRIPVHAGPVPTFNQSFAGLSAAEISLDASDRRTWTCLRQTSSRLSHALGISTAVFAGYCVTIIMVTVRSFDLSNFALSTIDRADVMNSQH